MASPPSHPNSPARLPDPVERWNDTRQDYPRHLCLHQLVEAQVSRHPDSVAVEFEGASLTWGELNSRANQLASRLRSLGAGPDRLVAHCVDRSLDMVVAVLGILKSDRKSTRLNSSH